MSFEGVDVEERAAKMMSDVEDKMLVGCTSGPDFIKVDGWDRLAWLSIAAKIHDGIIDNGVTFRQATGMDSRE